MRACLFIFPFVTSLLLSADIQIAHHSIPAGSRLDFEIPVPGGSDPASLIPVSVFHGASPGPTLLISAGVHGAEYVPILAVQRLLSKIDAKSLSGTVILVRLTHLDSFHAASVFYNPYDHKNLNRVFPGSDTGTQTERIAHIVTNELLKPADALIELHSGDATESLLPFVGIYGGAAAKKSYPLARKIGLSIGIQTVTTYHIDTPAQVQGNGRSLNRQAVADGKATVLVEIGDRGRRDDHLVSQLSHGILNMLCVMEMLPGRGRKEPEGLRWLAGTVTVTPKSSGIFYPLKEAGMRIHKGESVGYVTDLLANRVEDLISPVDGIILYMPYAPPLNSGESSPLVVGLLNPAPPVLLKKVQIGRGGDQPHTLPLLM